MHFCEEVFFVLYPDKTTGNVFKTHKHIFMLILYCVGVGAKALPLFGPFKVQQSLFQIRMVVLREKSLQKTLKHIASHCRE